MRHITVAAVTLNQTPLDFEGNLSRIIAALEKARESGAKVVLLPELALTGYGCEDAFQFPWVTDMALRSLRELVSYTDGLIVSVGLPLRVQGALYNVAALIVDREIKGFVAKQNLAGDGIHYEARWFKRWEPGVQSTVAINGQEYPVGDLYFDIEGVRIGYEICEDAWVSDRPGRRLASRAVDIILNPSASHFAFGKDKTRLGFILDGSRAFCTSYVYANLLGNEAGRVIYDGDCLVASNGRLIARGRRFSYQPFEVLVASIDVDLTRSDLVRSASFRPEQSPDSARVVVPGRIFPHESLSLPEKLEREPWELSPDKKAEEFARSATLGLFDYMRKSRAKGFVVSLSGGADSTIVSLLVRLMVEFGVRELGGREFCEALGLTDEAGTVDEITGRLLTCVYQKTANSSQKTENSARQVAAALGASFHLFNIDELVTRYEAMVSEALGITLSWEEHDIPRQNLQARVRAPGVWMVANIKRALLLVTSNRSEADVGYATMDGDTSGGLNPIGGVDKTYLRKWLVWMEMIGPEGLHSFPVLSLVNCLQPSAELRPLATNQTDEDDLGPYVVRDDLERHILLERRTPFEALRLLRAKFPVYDTKTLATWIEKWCHLWAISQWKRERFAPTFHMDDVSVDPRSWCRFPILSAGFAAMLKIMWNDLHMVP